MDSSVYGRKQNTQGMYTPTGSKEKKVAEVGMVKVTTASVDPGTVVIHLHHAPAEQTNKNAHMHIMPPQKNHQQQKQGSLVKCLQLNNCKIISMP